jgi:hypothetical protein
MLLKSVLTAPQRVLVATLRSLMVAGVRGMFLYEYRSSHVSLVPVHVHRGRLTA